MEPIRVSRIDIFKAMPMGDKLLTVFLAVMGIALFANGLYLVGHKGLLLLLGAIVFHFIAEIYKGAEIKIIAEAIEKKSAKSTQAPTVGTAAAENNNGLIRNIIDKKKQNPQQDLLNSLMDNLATPAKDEEQARADHEFLVEMYRKKQEAMRTATVPGPSVDPSVKKKIIEKQQAYVKELMKPTIVPQRELSKKSTNKDKN
ncbi:MAG: hypothetical protein QNJ97_05395 [Myxococcota bacterium]|nr:hypothetical protein [Myxococcota bacterium]